jgi:carbon storage regulator CsrA
MLVLSRKQSQQIVIGPDIRITIVKIERNQVRLGIEAPREVTVLRKELTPLSEANDDSERVGTGRGLDQRDRIRELRPPLRS